MNKSNYQKSNNLFRETVFSNLDANFIRPISHQIKRNVESIE